MRAQPYQQVNPAVQQQAAAQAQPQQQAAQAAQQAAQAPPQTLPSAARPPNAAVIFEYHCVGVQNYTTRALPCSLPAHRLLAAMYLPALWVNNNLCSASLALALAGCSLRDVQ